MPQHTHRPNRPMTREAERESAHAGRRGLGASEQRSARRARAAHGPPGVLIDGPGASLYGSDVDTLAMALATRDRFFLSIEARDRRFERQETARFLRELGAREVSEVAH